jgi:thiamine-monophosphate kinase
MRHIPLGDGREFDLIRRFLGDAGSDAVPVPAAVRVGPGDDCAIVRGEGLALSVDMSVEGVHFLREWLEPEEIGYRAAAAALSDLAATAAVPIGVLVALALRTEDVEPMATLIMDGVRAAAAGQRAVLLGGDNTRSPGPIVIDVVVVGDAARPVLRTGACPGDSIWVTGELGAATAAVRAWRTGRAPDAAARLAFALPTPRTAEAVWLAGRGVLHALIDVSDGLAGDVAHIAAASGVQVVLDAASIPVHPVLHAGTVSDPLALALSGGEDYELCFAAPPGAVENIVQEFTDAFDLRLTCVGSVHDGGGVMLRRPDGSTTPLDQGGYDHFAAKHG